MRGAINGYVLVRSRAALLMFAAPQPVSPARKMAQCRVDLRRCHGLGYHRRLAWRLQRLGDGLALDRDSTIGRASGRERVCQNVWISVVAVSLTKKNEHSYSRITRYTNTT